MTRHWARCSVFRIQTRLSFPITIPTSRGMARHLVIHRVSNVCFSLSDFSSPRNVRLSHVKSTRFRKETCVSLALLSAPKFIHFGFSIMTAIVSSVNACLQFRGRDRPEGFCGESRQRFTFLSNNTLFTDVV